MSKLGFMAFYYREKLRFLHSSVDQTRSKANPHLLSRNIPAMHFTIQSWMWGRGGNLTESV